MENKNRIYLGLDWGEKRIGMALAHGEVNIAGAYGIADDMDGVLRAVKDEGITNIIIGKPIRLSGEISKDHPFFNFLKDLEAKVDIPIIQVDERYSSKEADNLTGASTGKAISALKKKGIRDSTSAVLILQNFLDSISNDE
jgi:putative Holliday junction resolvase